MDLHSRNTADADSRTYLKCRHWKNFGGADSVSKSSFDPDEIRVYDVYARLKANFLTSRLISVYFHNN